MLKVIFFVILSVHMTSFAMTCNGYFVSQDTFKHTDSLIVDLANQGKNQIRLKETKAKDVLISIFDAIDRAEPNSTVTIFTPSLKLGGISSLLLFQMVSKSKLRNGVTFKIFLTQDSTPIELIGMMQESSNIKIRFLAEGVVVDSGHTLVLSQTAAGLESIIFAGALNRSSLKKDDVIYLPIRLPDLNRLKTASFRTNIAFDRVLHTDEAVIQSVLVQAEEIASLFELTRPTRDSYAISTSDQNFLNSKSYEMALQLYYEKLKKQPKSDRSSLGLLQDLLKALR